MVTIVPPIVTVVLLVLFRSTHAKFVGVTITANSATHKKGCMPTQFSNDGPTTKVTDILYLNDGCQATDYPNDLTGKSVAIKLVDGGVGTACSVSSRVARAKAKGAVGVVIFNYLDGEIPYPLSWDYTQLLPGVRHGTTSSVGINMAVCLAYYSNIEQLFPQGISVFTVDWTNFARWDRKNEPTSGTHTVSY